MSFHLFGALERLGLSAQQRALHLTLSDVSLNSQVYLQRIQGQQRRTHLLFQSCTFAA